MSSKKIWSLEEQQRLVSMVDTGRSIEDLCTEFKCGREAVCNKIQKLKIKGVITRNGQASGIGIEKLKQVPWSEKETKALIAAYAKKLTFKEIAVAIGRPTYGVMHKVKLLIEAGTLKPRKEQHFWTDQQENMLQKLLDAGVPKTKIAAEIGVSLKRVEYKIKNRRRSTERRHRSPAERTGVAPVLASPIIRKPPEPAVKTSSSTIKTNSRAADYLNSLGRDLFTPSGPGFWMVNGLRRIDESQLVRRAENHGFSS
jgi:biotin operon repressor